MPQILIPMLWFSEEADISLELAAKSKTMRTLKDDGLWASYILASIGTLLLVIGILLALRGVEEIEDESDISPIIDNESPTGIESNGHIIEPEETKS